MFNHAMSYSCSSSIKRTRILSAGRGFSGTRRFGSRTRWSDGVLEIDREAALAAVREDVLVASARLEIVHPGESVRMWPVRDVVEPRVKVDGPGVIYPGWFGRSIETVGRGRTHRLGGLGVVEVSTVNWHDAGGDFVDQYIDMSMY